MKPLEWPESHHLEAAIGWLELGSWSEANEELERITPTMRGHPDVLSVRCKVYCDAHKWDYAAEVANALRRMLPESPFGPLYLAHALRKLQRPAEARDVLLPIADKFQKEWCIPFQLACCFAQLGRFKDCESWLKEAMAIDEAAVQKSAVDDPHLIPLWDTMKGSLWRRE
jgi:predicted Zn-dependent protease